MLWWWLRKLQSTDPSVRRKNAARLYFSLSPRALAGILQMQTDPDSTVRNAADGSFVEYRASVALLSARRLKRWFERTWAVEDESVRHAVIQILVANAVSYKLFNRWEEVCQLLNHDPNWRMTPGASRGVDSLVLEFAKEGSCYCVEAMDEIDPEWPGREGARNIVPKLMGNLTRYRHFEMLTQ